MPGWDLATGATAAKTGFCRPVSGLNGMGFKEGNRKAGVKSGPKIPGRARKPGQIQISGIQGVVGRLIGKNGLSGLLKGSFLELCQC